MLVVRTVVVFCIFAIAQGKIAKIFNGSSVVIEERPFQVSLRSSENLEHFCGGSILNENYVITAGHCTKLDWITLQPEQIQVAVGNIKKSHPKSVHKVISIKRHERFRIIGESAINDIALLKVTPPFNFDDDVAPIVLPKPHLVIHPRTKGVMSGWGTLTYPKINLPEELKIAMVWITDQEYCRKAYEASNETVYPSKHLCTHDVSSLRKGPCRGDSGGPLTINGNQLVGIISWSHKDPGCASSRFPNVYTRVSEYINWIKRNAV